MFSIDKNIFNFRILPCFAALAVPLGVAKADAQDIAQPLQRAAMVRSSIPQGMSPNELPQISVDDSGAALEEEDLCAGADVCYDLSLRYVDGELRNPAFAKDDPRGVDTVRLRAYAGLVLDEDNAPISQSNTYVAPVVELAPGDTFRLTFENELPRPQAMVLPGEDANGNALTCADQPEDHNQPHCAQFNLTNVHTHGLWVSPLGNSDNVLLTVNPGI